MIGSVGEGLYELGVDDGCPGSARAGYGGDTANTAVMAARLGGGRFCGRVGDDALGRELLAFWRDAASTRASSHSIPRRPGSMSTSGFPRAAVASTTTARARREAGSRAKT